MAVLTPQQRNALESAVKQARRLAESGARNALQALAVDNPEPFSHMKPEQRSLRNRLRSKARLLGDELPSNGQQQINHLAYELAYEYWHKMLFAKFLEVNELLMHPDGVPVTMEECEELAREEGYEDKWDAAAEYASKMLPAIFRPDDPLMQLTYSPNDRINLEEIIDQIDSFTFSADDSLGWVYQYWQSEVKDEINKSGDRIDGEKLPAVTQLFTEQYMVNFLIDNTIGAWWVRKNPGVKTPVNFHFLRLQDEGKPAVEGFEDWPDKTADVTALDPCMGSGHFIVTLFTVFVNLRMFEENLTKQEATDRVISENLYGLEIDPRCTQIAAFNLALTAWKFCGSFKELPEMNLACSGLSPKGKVEDWINIVRKTKDPVQKTRLENGMRELYDHFQLAPELGSLIDPTTVKPDAFTASYNDLLPMLNLALEDEHEKDTIERGVIAAGIAKAGKILSGKYNLQITNVPYLSFGKLDEKLADYCKNNYPDSKGDLALVFLERMLKNKSYEGVVSCVTIQNWLFLSSYKKLRNKLLKQKSWSFIVRLGPKAFQTPMWDFNVMLLSIKNSLPSNEHEFIGIEASQSDGIENKISSIVKSGIRKLSQFIQLKNPDGIISIDNIPTHPPLAKSVYVGYGSKPGHTIRVTRFFWEISPIISSDWVLMESTPSADDLYSGKSEICLSLEQIEKQNVTQFGVRGKYAWGKKGLLLSKMGDMNFSFYCGQFYDDNTVSIIPKESKNIKAIATSLITKDFQKDLRKLNQKVSVAKESIEKLPFDLEYWQEKSSSNFPNGIPDPYSEDITQWLFHGNSTKSEYPLQVSVLRLLGYRWPTELDNSIEISAEAKVLVDEITKHNSFSDDDGIVCIPSVNIEGTAADRLRDFLSSVYGDSWNNGTIAQLLSKENAKSPNLNRWLRNEFFIQHCKIFKNRPFIWHIYDGRNDGFSALVNYHKLNKENFSKLIYTYLGDWIRMCELKKRNQESGAEGLLSAALKLKEKLELILEGESPYDIFVRWKPIEQQPIGWDPDLNDGVRLNIRPFIEADVLRKRPNIKYGVDRGKNPPGSPWGEKRDNDIHLTLAEKIEAREKVKKDNGR